MLNRSLIQMLERMIRPPPPIPWIARPASNILTLILSAAISDATKNTTLATSNIGFRPQMSLNLPHIGVEEAAASRYADPIHV